MLLWLEYKEAHPDKGYSYSQFCHHYRAHQAHLDLVMRQERRAGEKKLFVDFPGQRLPIYDRGSGEVALRAELFVAVLGASRPGVDEYRLAPVVKKVHVDWVPR